jgi:hypothetical protein
MECFLPSKTKSELIAKQLAPYETEDGHIKVIDYTLCDDVLWVVSKVTAKAESKYCNLAPGQSRCYIYGYLLRHRKNGWCYRLLDEAPETSCYSCPLRYLDMAPELCPEWRRKVREYHGRRAA